MTKCHKVAVYFQNKLEYAHIPPYHPPESYPEYPFGEVFCADNEVYASVRNSFYLLGLDATNYGKKIWNPLGEIIHPGDTVLIKPNLIAESQKNNWEWECLITHGSVIRAIIDYVYIALKGQGEIIVADAPQEDSDIERIKDRIGIEAIRRFYEETCKFDIQFLDLRTRHLISSGGVFLEEIPLKGDPRGYTRIDLGKESYFVEHDGRGKKYYGAHYDIAETNLHHCEGVHEYLVSRSVLDADVFISVPKLKTHKKVGVTLNLKGLVGISGNKNWLPHYAIGSPADNGDQFDRKILRSSIENSLVIQAKRVLLKKNKLLQWIARFGKKLGYRIFGATEEVIRSGNWYGNDTCWRMVLDLNRILRYYSGSGKRREMPRRYFSIVDGIVGMEGNGPLDGDRKNAGVIVAGLDFVCVDLVCATLMGFDFRKIKMLYRALDNGDLSLTECKDEDIQIVSNRRKFNGPLDQLLGNQHLSFKPHFGWAGKIENIV